jgi:BirA family biotin operon repressor/biotin-[acetyl-CoA-carboxylase] ligase
VLTTIDLERALARAGLAAPVRADEVTGCTNATALEMAEAGAPEWTLVAAGHQTRGRGRLGRTWQDRPGDLMCSFVLRPGQALAPARAGLLTLLAGAAAAEAARELDADVGCKWPNDLMVREAKAGGILAEASVAGDELRYLVVGVGVNLGEPPPVRGAASLGAVDAGELLAGFLTAFRSRYDPAAPGFVEGVRSIARATSVTLGRRVAATRLDGARVRGRAVDLDPDGGLVVMTDAGARETIAFGEVSHLER